MNKIYRIVWNASTAKWVVASELAAGRKKGGKRRTLCAVVAMTAAVGGMGSQNAHAYVAGNNATQGNPANTVIGDNASGSSSACVT